MLEIGDSLREARTRRELALPDIERATHIRVQQLEALEREQFDLLPPEPYRRSFLREYAEFLGLDGDLYTAEYTRRFAETEPAALPPPHRRHTGGLASRRLLIGIAVVALIAVAGLTVTLLSRSGGKGSLTPPHATVGQTHPKPRPHSRHQTTTTPAPTRRSLVLTAARGSCWLWVRIGSSTGRTIYQRTLQHGRTLRFGLRAPLWIRIGAPWNLDAEIGHRSLTQALPPRTGDVLATTTGFRPTP